ncbi:hypothetical protein F4860DRAFT_477778 [Xylaria cubensis]|nr:hypothetical protein F4860DRAFT_477778 [Xylaria cubensis]
MESLAALGLAAAVVQFVDFAKNLLLDTRDIYRSEKGALEDNLRLEQICEVLKRLSGELVTEQDHLVPSRESAYHLVSTEDALGLKNLASSCKADCDELLSIMRNLSVDTGANRRWNSIKASVKNFQRKGQIKGLEDRIAKAQNLMTLHVQSVIRDQVASLSATIDSLNQGNKTHQLRQDEKLDRITQDINYLKICGGYEAFSPTDIEQTANRLSICLPLQDELARLQRILCTLQFDMRPIRHNSIPEAHVTTLKWIFKSKFSSWLRDGDGIFWISGKAGSGKSTMMKFIADHKMTNQIANEWAALKPVVIACHYFWNSGTEMQRSQQGLLQTLLFDIFQQCPTLVPLVCSKRWEMARRVGMKFEPPWTIPELSACLQEIAGQNDSMMRFCLFIDGLDEFSGDHVDLCQVLQSLAKSRHMKLCVSSRPWNVFQDFFGQNTNTMLSIHELTWDDIRRFAQSRLQTHPRWETCWMSEEYQHQLVQEIAERAEGVFLWAFLVTQSLREGLSNDDTMMDLQQRLRSLPTDLERLFKNLLNGVDPVYHEYMAGIIQIARCAKNPLSLELYYHHEKQYQSDDYAFSDFQRLATDEHFKALELTRRRINSKTRGLLEVVSISNNNHIVPQSTRTVQFLHRTVRDFLKTREMDDFLSEKSRDNFDPALEICLAFLALIKYKIKTQFWGPNKDIHDEAELHDTLRYAAEVTSESVDVLVKALDELERTIMLQLSHGLVELSFAFRRLVLRYNLFRYVSSKLALNPIHFDMFEPGALFVALGYSRGSSFPSHDISLLPMDCITVLLEHGHDPNKSSSSKSLLMAPSSESLMTLWPQQLLVTPWSNGTPWSSGTPRSDPLVTPWSELFNLHFPGWDNANSFLTSDLLEIFLRNGANPNANITCRGDDGTKVSAFAFLLLGSFNPSFSPLTITTTYLNLLQKFLDSGADLDYQLHNSRVRWPFSLPIIDSFGRGSVCEAFSECLKLIAGKWTKLSDDDQRERHFFFSVTKKVLSQGVLRNSNIATLIEVIPVVFPEGLAEELVAIAPKASSSRNRRKRDPGVKHQKRQKHRR